MDSLINYIIHLSDNALILGHRNSEWCGHGPILEQDMAITNISLDLIGQARLFYQYAAELINNSGKEIVTEDTIAYLRNEFEYKNILLVEQPNGDWACTVLRQFLFSAYQQLLYNKLIKSTDKKISAIAEKALKEVQYHSKWSAEWVIRLGDGTTESHQRMVNAINDLWMYTNELFESAPYEIESAKNNIGVDVSILKNDWVKKITDVFTEATLPIPTEKGYQKGGKAGVHTEYLGYILTELQYVQRAYPGCIW